MELLCAVGEVGGKKGKSVGVEVEVMFEFVEEFFVGDGVVGFGEVEENCKCGDFVLFVDDDLVDD